MKSASLALWALLGCVFAVMVGYGIALPVLLLYAEQLLGTDAAVGAVALHAGLLVALYAGMQLVFAPAWGRLADRVGRRPLVLVGMTGFVLTAALFGVSTRLWMLYAARAVGGALSAALFPAASAFVADLTEHRERQGAMARLNGAVALGFLVGPLLGTVLVRTDIHVELFTRHLVFDRFSVPFVLAAVLGALALAAAARWLPESLAGLRWGRPATRGAVPWRRIRLVLVAGVATQLGVALFEATFTVYARVALGPGPAVIGAGFAACGTAMALTQALVVTHLRITARWIIVTGLALQGLGLALLAGMTTTIGALVSISIMGVGVGLVVPSLAVVVSREVTSNVGAALGTNSAAQSFGQIVGPVLGMSLVAWRADAPFWVASVVALLTALAFGSWSPTR